MYSEMEKIKAAYALNLWTVSISQIIEYNDVNVLKQEYDTIVNNINIEKMPKDEALLEVIKEIMDEITFSLKMIGDLKFVEKEYNHKLKNAIWSAVPNVGAIFATSNPIAMGVTLATQVGIGYMNYRRNKSEYELEKEKSKWEIESNRMDHLNGLQKQLFETAWRLADEYEFPDEYRLTDSQIKNYTVALMEENPLKRYNKLNAMKDVFNAYPLFWYQIGSAANSVFREVNNEDIKKVKKEEAIECFKTYERLNTLNLLRNDVITSSWALEYLELMNYNTNNEPEKARKLIEIAEKYSGGADDVIELCAFAYLRINDLKNAARLFDRLVNNNYNNQINVKLLSGIYIKMLSEKDSDYVSEAKVKYNEIKYILNDEDQKYIIPLPNQNVDLSCWNPEWDKDETIDEIIEKESSNQEIKRKADEKKAKKAIPFYKKRIVIVYKDSYRDEAIYFEKILKANRMRIINYVENVPDPVISSISEYKENRASYDINTHIIFLGDTKESKDIYKVAENEEWDYSNLGMKYVTSNNYTVILVEKIKNSEIDELINVGKKLGEKYSVRIPSSVESVKYKSFIKENFINGLKSEDSTERVATGLTGVFFSPLMVLGETVSVLEVGVQGAINTTNKSKIKFLQCSIAFYMYLESVDAML